MSRDNKAALKEVRELLKHKEYVDAMMKCKEIIKKDKTNYMAYTLLGAATLELEEYKYRTPAIFQKAIKLQPENILAYQGLVTYYEKESNKNHNTLNKLIASYCKLIEYESDMSKAYMILEKISDLLLSKKYNVNFNDAIKKLNSARENANEEKNLLISKSLAYILTENSDLYQFNDLLENVLSIVIKDPNVVNRKNYYKKYLKLLSKSNKISTLVDEVANMFKQFPMDSYPLELICRVYNDYKVGNKGEIDIDIVPFYKSLRKFNHESEFSIVAEAIHLQETGDLIRSREILNQLVLIKPKSFYGYVLLATVNKKLYCYESVENAATEVLRLSSYKSYLWNEINVLYVESLSRSKDVEKWKLAKKLCEEILERKSSLQVRLILARVNVLLNNDGILNELSNLESIPEAKVEAGVLQAMYYMIHNSLEQAVDILGSCIETSESWSLLGQIYWEMGDYNHSQLAFLNSVQTDRFNWESFIYLGQYYLEHDKDIERSKRSYQAALQINPYSEKAGIGLSTTLRLLNDSKANIELLQKLTAYSNGPKWAWLQLGLYYLDRGNANEAIKALQHVIRADPTDNHGWESLADAYLARGAYRSAIKSYQRALDLFPGSLYSSIQVANIKLLIGELEEAKEEFKNILNNESHYLPALKGLAEAGLGLATKNISTQFLGRARENLQQSIECLTDAVLINSKIICIWKLLGDVCHKSAMLSEKYCHFKVKPFLMNLESTEEYIVIGREDLFLLSKRSYYRALDLSKNSSLLWHDLACCYVSQLRLNSINNRQEIANEALTAAKYAVKLCPTSWSHWNILGIICMIPEVKNYALAQHCFIMSISKENNAIVWTNLGILYALLGEIYKANEAFSRAQQVDHDYMNSWAGQGVIAEIFDLTESLNLYRHATTLGYNNEACLGFAHVVITLVLNGNATKDPLYTYNIENMHSIPAAIDMLTWYIEHNSNNAHALNTCGLLLERQQLYLSAKEQFTKALYKGNEEEKDFIRINLARILLHFNQYEEAIKLCKSVQNVTFNSQCHLALCFFKAKQFEDSYNTYEMALKNSVTEDQKANVLCAMAAMTHIFQRVDDVKTLLFQCIMIKPPLIHGFLAAAALGILHGDLNLTNLVLNELKSYKNNVETEHHITTLTAYSSLVQNKTQDAIKVFSKLTYRFPNDPNCWINLARILFDRNSEIFCRCSQKALYLRKLSSSKNIIHIACASILNNLITENFTDALRNIQKAIFQFPNQIESWATFIAVFLIRFEERINTEVKFNAKWISKLITIVQQQFPIQNQIYNWLEKKKNIINVLL
ncbi:PREDICTED: tetratricopeptide repeat protein 37 [Polistes dominula]|uniref:Tetratricopeptide repeat protein 37 n=1 Tax=Polistes dominula TaxID=743375 RepID=A0ABM1I0H0_POLDO|nr:PREDICTED: tetratricopeptide repeat protein 37 [Polistes dominula]